MPRGVLVLDGYDTYTNLDLVLTTPLRGWRDHLWQQEQAKRTPQRISSIRTGVRTQSEPRAFQINGVMHASTHAQLETRMDELAWRLAGGTSANAPRIDVKFDTAATRHFRCYVDGEVTQEPRVGTPAVDVQIPLVALDPRAFSDSTTTVGPFTSASGDVALPIGNAIISDINISIAGASTFQLDYKDSGATLLESLGVVSATGTLPLIIEMEDETIVDSAGTPVSQMDFLDPTAQVFWEINPTDGNFLSPGEPLVATDAGTVTITYQRTYKNG